MKLFVWVLLSILTVCLGRGVSLFQVPVLFLILVFLVGIPVAIGGSFGYHMSTEGLPPSRKDTMVVVLCSILGGAALIGLTFHFIVVTPIWLFMEHILIACLMSLVAVSMMFIRNTYISY